MLRYSSKSSLRVVVRVPLLASILLLGLFDTVVARRGILEFFKKMGQAMRMVKYDRAANERNAVSALKMASHSLSWYKLDDPVMGGQSHTEHTVEDGYLHFKGTINTNGGGFASIRSAIPETIDLSSCKGLRLRIQGDGKTYKFFMTDGSRGGPMSRNPSWQMDVPTNNNNSDGEWQDVEIPFDQLSPSFGPRTPSDASQYKFDCKEMKEMGLMLSLKLADGSPNPKETFGEGIFLFSLKVESIDSIL